MKRPKKSAHPADRLAALLRDAYADAYRLYRPRETKAAWHELAVLEARMYRSVAVRLLAMGVELPEDEP